MSEYSYHQNINRSNTHVKQTAWTLNLISCKVKGRTSASSLIPFPANRRRNKLFSSAFGMCFPQVPGKEQGWSALPFQGSFPYFKRCRPILSVRNCSSLLDVSEDDIPQQFKRIISGWNGFG